MIPDRVVDSNDIKVFNINAEVYYLDDQEGANFEGCEVEIDGPVPVYGDTGKLVGNAVLSVSGRVLNADIYLDYYTPERLNIETNSIPLYPHLDCSLLVESDKTRTKVLKMTVNDIRLEMFPVEDERVSSL
jgi:hypothetical protein